ncbi:MAG: glycoside hydrolase family 18 protein [Bacilli bacterium]
MKNAIFIFLAILLLLTGCVEKPKTLNDDIASLPDASEVVFDDGVLIASIRTQIDSLSEEELQKITTINLERFIAIEAAYLDLLGQLQKEQEVETVEGMFSLLPPVDDLTIYYYENLENIKTAYEALDDFQKALFDNEKKILLEAYEQKMATILVPDYRIIEEVAYSNAVSMISLQVPSETTTSIVLPTEYISDSATLNISWRSSSALMSSNGEVIRADLDTLVFLTATITGLFIEDTYTIEVKIKGNLTIDLPVLDGSKKLTFAYLRDSGYGTNLVDRDYMKIDVINYSFGKISNGKLSVLSLSNLNNVLRLRAKGVRVVIVIDGVSTSTREAFILAASTEENREILATSIADVIEQYQFDGVDLDWEFPNGTTEKNNFSLLVKSIREKLDESDRQLILSAAVRSGGYSTHYDLVELNKYLDYLHIMSYGMSGSSSARHSSPLIKSTYATYAINASVDMYIAGGMDAQKIVFGIPFYVKIGTLANPAASALGQSLTNPISVGYSTFMASYFTQQQFVEYYDEAAMVYYAVSPTSFASYDNPESIRLKCEWAEENDIAGVMFWDYGHDKVGGTLLNAIYESFNPQA